ncbi:MAG: hypothetical protein IJ220_04710 [Clostridia bacterium]|nr:hypothetical protein [Clostridia bacterium]
MNNINFEEIFSQENISKYRKYFSVPEVVKEANKIVDAVKTTKELTDEENMASIILAVIILNQG